MTVLSFCDSSANEGGVKYDWISIGGGAAGVFGAICFAEKNPGKRVAIVEAGQRLLQKVKISGGGRCNVTHHCFDVAKLCEFYPRGSRELRSVFSRFQPKDMWEWFVKRGVDLKVESDGRVFPVSDSSQTIIDLFLKEMERLKVEIHRGVLIEKIDRASNQHVRLHSKSGAVFEAPACLAATGSSRAFFKVLEALGHRIEPLVASLFSFNIADPDLHALAGNSFENVSVRLTPQNSKELFESDGPLLVTHWGLSGPAVLKISAFAARALAESEYEADLSVNFLPAESEQKLRLQLQSKRVEAARTLISLDPIRVFSKRTWAWILCRAQIPLTLAYSSLSKKQETQLVDQLLRSKFRVSGKTTYKEEFVTAGGVSLKEIDFRKMESRLIPGLYFAGEVIDVDGVTGGFNFQNAWSGAAIAAQAASLSQRDS